MGSSKIRCAKCGTPKNPSQFNWKNEALGTRDPYCTPCRREYNKDHYRKNKQLYTARNKRTVERLLAFIDSLKEGKPCADCGNIYIPCAMEFDHLDSSTKVAGVAQLAHAYSSKRQILEEVAKCELVCAVCHRIRTCKRTHKHSHKRPQRLNGEAPLS